MKEYRVRWKRKGLREKRLILQKRHAAERRLVLLGPEPWLALGRAPDSFACCSGYECGCGGFTIRQSEEKEREKMPALEYAAIDEREVNEWEPAAAPAPGSEKP